MGILEVVVAVTVVGLGAVTISFRPPSLLHVPPRYEYEYEYEILITIRHEKTGTGVMQLDTIPPSAATVVFRA